MPSMTSQPCYAHTYETTVHVDPGWLLHGTDHAWDGLCTIVLLACQHHLPSSDDIDIFMRVK